MKAIIITQPGGPAVLAVEDRDDPRPQGDEVLIEVRASGLNRADIIQRQGNYPAPPGVPADIPGLEVAGVVVQCGPEVTLWKPGDKVCALIAGGGYAQYAIAREGQCLPVPVMFNFTEAAALPEAIGTVWSNVFQRGKLKAGENFLVHGGNSGIGTAAIQLAKAIGCTVYTTVGSEEKGNIALGLGADRFVNYKTQDFAIGLATVGIDVILDMVGGEYLGKNIRVLREEGRIVYINSVGGNSPAINLHQLMTKRITITGSTLRSRDYTWRKALSAEIQEKVWPIILAGQYKPLIYRALPYTQAADAHRLMESGGHSGKIILTWE
jgi:NADPH2:quinone reductase